MDKRIGAQFYTIRDFCKTPEDFDASCKKVKEIGYKTVQLSGIGNFKAVDIKNILDKYNLEVVCTHRPADNYLKNLDAEIEFHKTIGAKICGIGSMPGFSAEKETIEDFVKNFRPVIEKLKDNDLIFAYHNHAFEFAKTGGKYAFDLLNEKMDCDYFKFILDVYWLAVAGINPAEFITKYADKVACVHFKDLKVVGNSPAFAKVGEGNLEWDKIISACENSGVQFALVEQDVCDDDPFECLSFSYKYLKERGFE